MDNATQHLIQFDFESHTLIGDILSPGNSPQVLVLHGAGNSNRGRFRTLREELFAKGISSAAFDFVGHGDTGGDLKNSSLSSRTRQACRVVDDRCKYVGVYIGQAAGALSNKKLDPSGARHVYLTGLYNAI
jgi:hypothetical protein